MAENLWEITDMALEYGFVGRQFRRVLHSLGERESSEVRHCMLLFSLFRVPWTSTVEWLGREIVAFSSF